MSDLQLLRCHAFHQTCIKTYCGTVNVGVAEMRCPVCKLSSTDVNKEEIEIEFEAGTPRVPTPTSWSELASTAADANIWSRKFATRLMPKMAK